MTRITIQAKQHSDYLILNRISGETSCEISFIGLKVIEILPSGAGKNGFWFGSSRPLPTEAFSARSFGMTSICILTFPESLSPSFSLTQKLY